MNKLFLVLVTLCAPLFAAHPTITTWSASPSAGSCASDNRTCTIPSSASILFTYALAGTTCATTQIAGATWINAGTGYTTGDVLTITQGGASGGQVKVLGITGGGSTGPILSVMVIAAGTGYTNASGLATTGGTGTGATVKIVTNVCQIRDSFNNIVTLSSASGTQSITPASSRYYYLIATTLDGWSVNMGSCGFDSFNEPTADCRIEYYVAVGGNTLSVTTNSPSTMASGMSWDFHITYSGAGCDTWNISTACTGLTSNHNPFIDAAGTMVITGATSGKVYRVDFTFCAGVYCPSGNGWEAHFMVPGTIETFNYVWVFGSTTDYKTGSGSFTSLFGSCYVCFQPIQPDISNNRLWKNGFDGRVIYPIGYNGAGHAQAGTLLTGSSATNSNDVGGGAQTPFVYFEWSNSGSAGYVMIPKDSAASTSSNWSTGCYNGTNLSGVPPGSGCTTGGLYLLPDPSTPTTIGVGNQPNGAMSLFETLRTYAKFGAHTFIGTVSRCDNTPYVAAQACDPSGDMDKGFAYLQQTRLTADELGPYLEMWYHAYYDQGNCPTLSYLNTEPDYFRTFYPKRAQSFGELWPAAPGVAGCPGFTGNVNLDFTFAQSYISSPWAPAVGYSTYYDASDTVTRLTNAPNTRVMTMEGGSAVAAPCSPICSFGPENTDHPYNEIYPLQMLWYSWVRQINYQPFNATSGNGVNATLSPKLSNSMIGTQEEQNAAVATAYMWDFDPTASIITASTGSCAKTLYTRALGSTRDLMIVVSNNTDRNTASSCTVSLNVPGSGMQGQWYRAVDSVSEGLLGTMVGSPITLGAAGVQTVSIPSFKDHLVFRARKVDSSDPIIRTVMLPAILQNTAYTSTTLVAQGGSSPYTWRVVEGAFPPGMSMSSAGVVSGTPTKADWWTVVVKAQDSMGRDTAPQLYRIPVIEPLRFWTNSFNSYINLRTSATPALFQFDGLTGGVPPVSATYDSAFTSSFTADPRKGSMGGYTGTTKSTAVAETVGITATDAAGNIAHSNLEVNVVTFGPNIPTRVQRRTLTKNTFYTICITKIAASGTATWGFNGTTAPTGMTLVAANCGGNATNGLYSGTPTVSGTYNFSMGYTDTNGSAFVPVTMFVVDPVSFTTTSPLPSATQGTPYYQTLVTANGSQPISCKLGRNSFLPAGMMLAPHTCTVYGTTAFTGTTIFTVEAWEPTFAYTPGTFSLSVLPSGTGGGGSHTLLNNSTVINSGQVLK